MQLIASGPNHLTWRDTPRHPLEAGEVRIRTRLSAVSVASELSTLQCGPFPQRLGYQTLGVVEAAGPERVLAPGARVVSTLGHASGGVLRETALIPVPDSVSDRVALCTILGEETHKGIRRLAPRTHERVLVSGAGLLGLLSVFNLTRRGIRDVTVLEPDPARRALAGAFGAAAYAPGDLPHGAFDMAVECSAAPAGFSEVLRHLRPGGRCAVLSDGNWGALTLSPEFHSRELTVFASSDGEDYAAYARWLWAHADPLLESLFPETVKPRALPATFTRLTQWPRPVSVVVDWTAG